MPGNAFIESAIASAGVLVHLGAGKCRELSDYEVARAGKAIVLVEAHPDLARGLKARIASMKNTKVVNCAVSAESGERVFHAYNLPERSSLRPATGLKALYPGLRLMKEIPFTTRSAASLMETIEPEGEHSVCLVIDTPGEELAILQSLIASDRIKSCQSIILKCAKQSLYEESASAPELRELLETSGYETRVTEEGEDPEFITLGFGRNVWKLESLLAKKALEEHREAASKEIEALRAERSALEGKIATGETAAQATIDSLKRELDEQRKALDEQIESAKADRIALEGKLAARATEAQGTIDSLNKELSGLRETLASQVETLKGERGALEETLAAKDAETQEVIGRLNGELEETREALAQARAHASHAETSAREHSRALGDERDVLSRELAQLKSEHAALLESRKAEKGEVQEQKAELGNKLEIASNELATEKERNSRAEASFKEQIASLEKEREKLQAEVDRLQTSIRDQTSRLRTLESEHTELLRRQKFLDVEVARAEGQVSLIRDVLLTDGDL